MRNKRDRCGSVCPCRPRPFLRISAPGATAPHGRVSNVAAAIFLTSTKEVVMKPPPPTNSRARRLYERILQDLDAARSAHGPEREAVLLRISRMVGDLAEIAEGAHARTDAPTNEGPTRGQVYSWLSRISLELLRILGGADVYTALNWSARYGTRWNPILGSSYEADSTVLRAVAA